MKKVLKLMLALVMTCAVAGCSSSSKNDADVTITIGTSPDYAPYESLNKKGEIVGFDVDMAKLFEGYKICDCFDFIDCITHSNT